MEKIISVGIILALLVFGFYKFYKSEVKEEGKKEAKETCIYILKGIGICALIFALFSISMWLMCSK